MKNTMFILGLNPCFCGSRSMSRSCGAAGFTPTFRLNPCFCGSRSMSVNLLMIWILISCFTPCFCGGRSMWRLTCFLTTFGFCLNPCFCGSRSMSCWKRFHHQFWGVLILVFVEVGLWVCKISWIKYSAMS